MEIFLPKNNCKAQQDYIFMNKKWINSALNCESYFSFKRVSSDHKIVSAKIHLSLFKNKQQTVNVSRYDWYDSQIMILATDIR